MVKNACDNHHLMYCLICLTNSPNQKIHSGAAGACKLTMFLLDKVT